MTSSRNPAVRSSSRAPGKSAQVSSNPLSATCPRSISCKLLPPLASGHRRDKDQVQQNDGSDSPGVILATAIQLFFAGAFFAFAGGAFAPGASFSGFAGLGLAEALPTGPLAGSSATSLSSSLAAAFALDFEPSFLALGLL